MIKIFFTIRNFYRFIILLLLSLLIGINLYNRNLILKPRISYESLEKLGTIYKGSYLEEEMVVNSIKSVEKQPKDVNSLYVTGWMADWGLSSGYNDLINRIDSFDGASPVWFTVNADGSLNEIYSTINNKLMQLSHQRDFELIPSIALFNSDIFTQILNNEENLTHHINQIVDKVIGYNYDGIDLDYEDSYLADKGRFFEFLSRLKSRLNEHGKILVFSALSKWGDNIIYNISNQTRRVFDYKRISDNVDELRIMAYDYIGTGSRYAGPIAPLEWVEYVLKYAIFLGVPREKIVLGIHNYSYVWTERELLPAIDFLNTDSFYTYSYDFGNNALSYNYEDVEYTLSNYSVNVSFNEFWGEKIARFTKDGIPRIMVYLGNDEIALRKKLAADYGVKGVSYWRLGENGNLQM